MPAVQAERIYGALSTFSGLISTLVSIVKGVKVFERQVGRSDGSQVVVNLDKNFNVLGTPVDSEDKNGQDSAHDDGD